MANKDKYTKEEVLDALTKSGGFISIACKLLGCTRKTIYNYLDRYEELKEKLDDINYTYDDKVEAKIIEKAVRGETRELIWYATHKQSFKERGYSNKQELDITSNQEKIQINILPFEED